MVAGVLQVLFYFRLPDEVEMRVRICGEVVFVQSVRANCPVYVGRWEGCRYDSAYGPLFVGAYLTWSVETPLGCRLGQFSSYPRSPFGL
jgi:hypothetical protein